MNYDIDDIFEELPEPELVRCEGCNRLFPKSKLRKCHTCGEVLCKSCQKKHRCSTRTTSHQQHMNNAWRNYQYSTNKARVSYRSSFGFHWKAIVPVVIGVISLVVLSAVFVGCIPASNTNDMVVINTPSTTTAPIETPANVSPSTTVKVTPTIVSTPTVTPTPTESTTSKSSVSNPHIVLSEDTAGTKSRTASFRVGNNQTKSITITADSKVYQGAKSSNSKILSNDNYYAMMTLDSAQDDFYSGILYEFRRIQNELNLDSDEFVELVTSYVQTIPYDSNAPVTPRYPVETALDNFGDCDEKSMLLAGILSKAGYDVVLFNYNGTYGDAGHMNVGIKTNDSTAYKSGYSMIETTIEGSFVTENTLSTMNSPVIYDSLIKIGNGTKTYTAGEEVSKIGDYIYGLDKEMDFVDSKADSCLEKSDSYLAQLDSINAKMENLNRQYNMGMMNYSQYSSSWDSLDAQYETTLRNYNRYYDAYADNIELYNKYVEINNKYFVNPCVCDRSEIYKVITNTPLKYVHVNHPTSPNGVRITYVTDYLV